MLKCASFQGWSFSTQPISDFGEMMLMHSHFDMIHDSIPSLADKLHIPTPLEALLSCHYEEKWKVHKWSKNAFCRPLLFMLGCSLQELFWNVLALGFEVFQKKNSDLYLCLTYISEEERAESFVSYIYPRCTLLLNF